MLATLFGLWGICLLVAIEYDGHEWANWLVLASTFAGFILFLIYGIQTLRKGRNDAKWYPMGLVLLLSFYRSKPEEDNTRLALIIMATGCGIMCLIFVFLALHIF